MAKIDKITFDYTEIITALLKKEGIHDGIWMIYVEFGFAAVNAPVDPPKGPAEPSKEELLNHLMPTAVLPVRKIGIQRADRLSNLAVDAAKVNPKQSGGKRVRK